MSLPPSEHVDSLLSGCTGVLGNPLINLSGITNAMKFVFTDESFNSIFFPQGKQYTDGGWIFIVYSWLSKGAVWVTQKGLLMQMTRSDWLSERKIKNIAKSKS